MVWDVFWILYDAVKTYTQCTIFMNVCVADINIFCIGRVDGDNAENMLFLDLFRTGVKVGYSRGEKRRFSSV